jgi:hypothetical protein
MTQKNQDDFSNTLQQSLKLINSIGPDEFAKIMSPKREEVEAIFQSSSPFTENNALKLIIDYALILNAFHSEDAKNGMQRIHYQELLAACFCVGFSLGVGKDCVAALPMLALSGSYLELGKKLLREYDTQLVNSRLK